MEEDDEFPMVRGMVVRTYFGKEKITKPPSHSTLINLDIEVEEGGWCFDFKFLRTKKVSKTLVKNLKNGYCKYDIMCVIVPICKEVDEKLGKYEEGEIVYVELKEDGNGDYLVTPPYKFVHGSELGM